MSNGLNGKIDLLGLNAMGNPSGLHPTWGILIGGGVSNVTSMVAARVGGKAARHADLIGFLSGAAIGGTLYAMGSKTRGAGLSAIATAFVSSGMKWLERVLFGPAPAVAGVGLPMIQSLNGNLGLPTIQALNGGGMGLPSMSNVPVPAGTIPGVAGIQVSGGGVGAPPVSLLGHQAHGGGPMVSGLSARYGATLLGAR